VALLGVAVESEDRARARVGVAQVAEVGFDASGLVSEGEWVSPSLGDELLGFAIAGGLLRYGGQGGADFLGFDDAEGFAVNKEHVNLIHN